MSLEANWGYYWDPWVGVTSACTVYPELLIILHLLHLDKHTMIFFFPNSSRQFYSSGMLHTVDRLIVPDVSRQPISPLQMGLIGCPEMLVTSTQSIRCVTSLESKHFIYNVAEA